MSLANLRHLRRAVDMKDAVNRGISSLLSPSTLFWALLRVPASICLRVSSIADKCSKRKFRVLRVDFRVQRQED